MARICKPCHMGDHADCPRYMWQQDCCDCLCDEAPRQLSLWGPTMEPRPAPAGAERRPAPARRRKE